MKLKELKNIFIEYGVPKELYNLEGKGRKDERFCLEYTGDKWNVFYVERGCRTTDLFFDSEEEACLYLYKELIE